MPSPAILIAIGWLLTAAVGAGGTLWYANLYHTAEASIEKAAGEAEKAVNDAKAADAKQTAILAEQAEQDKATLQGQLDDANRRLSAVKSNPACDHTDASNVFDSIMFPSGGSAPSGTARPAPAKPDGMPPRAPAAKPAH